MDRGRSRIIKWRKCMERGPSGRGRAEERKIMIKKRKKKSMKRKRIKPAKGERTKGKEKRADN